MIATITIHNEFYRGISRAVNCKVYMDIGGYIFGFKDFLFVDSSILYSNRIVFKCKTIFISIPVNKAVITERVLVRYVVNKGRTFFCCAVYVNHNLTTFTLYVTISCYESSSIECIFTKSMCVVCK